MCRPDMWGDNVLFDLARLQTNCDVSRMMMASEAIVDGASPEFIVASWWPYTQYHILPHNDMADVLFVDGHVKALGAGAVFSNYPGILQQ
jgi:prepilin-type processing-associated H-X9-DG protein